MSPETLFTRSRTVLLVALLLAGPALAGCVSPDGGAELGPAAAEDGEAAGPGNGSALAAFPGASPETLHANGTFAAHEPVVGSFPVELVFGFDGEGPHQIDEDFHEVTEHVPQGVPTNISATLTYPDEQADMTLFVSTGEDVRFHGFEAANGDGSARLWTTLSRFGDASVDVVVNSNAPGQAADTPYRVQVNVTPAATRLPANAPAAVDVPEEATGLRLTPVASEGETPLVTRAWTPDDAYLGDREAEAGAGAPYPVEAAGEHVVVASAPVHVQVLGLDGAPAAGPEMRTLSWTFQEAVRTPLDPASGSASFEMEADRAPLSAYVEVSSGDGGERPGTPARNVEATVSSPDGTVVDAGPDCGVFCTVVLTRIQGGYDVGAFAPFNATGLVDGTYQGEVQADPAANVEVAGGWVHYER